MEHAMPERRLVYRGVCTTLCVALAIQSSGCSLFVGSTQPVTITASDPRAAIFVDGEEVGQGSVTLNLRRNRSHGVMAKVGDRSGAAHISTQISPTGVLDIIGGLLLIVPFLGALSPGFWALDPDNVHIALPPPHGQSDVGTTG